MLLVRSMSRRDSELPDSDLPSKSEPLTIGMAWKEEEDYKTLFLKDSCSESNKRN